MALRAGPDGVNVCSRCSGRLCDDDDDVARQRCIGADFFNRPEVERVYSPFWRLAKDRDPGIASG